MVLSFIPSKSNIRALSMTVKNKQLARYTCTTWIFMWVPSPGEPGCGGGFSPYFMYLLPADISPGTTFPDCLIYHLNSHVWKCAIPASVALWQVQSGGFVVGRLSEAKRSMGRGVVLRNSGDCNFFFFYSYIHYSNAWMFQVDAGVKMNANPPSGVNANLPYCICSKCRRIIRSY